MIDRNLNLNQNRKYRNFGSSEPKPKPKPKVTAYRNRNRNRNRNCVNLPVIVRTALNICIELLKCDAQQQVMDMIFNDFLIKNFNRIDKWKKIKKHFFFLKYFLNSSEKRKYIVWKVLSSYFGFRLHFEPKFRPKPKVWTKPKPKPKLIPKQKFRPKPKPKPKISDHYL